MLGRSLNSMIMGPLPDFIYCEVSSLIRSNVVNKNMMDNKELCKLTDNRYERTIPERVGKKFPAQ
jgi:hypothetical protein